MSDSSSPVGQPAAIRRRRRGPELESALLEAAWAELVEAGFSNLTMESVAARAHTGVAVLYRRWPNKDELVIAAIEHYRETHPIAVEDTGSLRGDLLGVLTSMSEARATFTAIAAATGFSGLLSSTGLTPAQLRERIFGERARGSAATIYDRAAARGEIDLSVVPADVLAMPFDLVRHDMIMALKPLESGRIRSIVDELFLPLVEALGASPAAQAGTTNMSQG